MNEQNVKTEGRDVGALAASRAILCTVSRHRLGIKRDVRAERVLATDLDTEEGMLTVSKKLIDSPEYDAIVRLDGDFYRGMLRLVLPSRFRRGTYLLPVALLAKAEEKIDLYRSMRQALVFDFLNVYDQRCQEAAAQLGPLYNEKDYPSLAAVERAFGVEVAYEAYSAPALLESIDAGLYAREQARVEQAMQDMATEAREALRVGLLSVVGKLQEELAPKADGTPRKLYDSVIDALGGFLDTLEARNITSDADLSAVGEQLRAVMQGVDRKALKANRGLREEVSSALQAASACLVDIAADAPRRKFAFDA